MFVYLLFIYEYSLVADQEIYFNSRQSGKSQFLSKLAQCSCLRDILDININTMLLKYNNEIQKRHYIYR